MKCSLLLGALCVLSLVSCKGKVGDASPSGQPVASTTAASGYEGPTGVVRGVVRIAGDAPPELPGAHEIPVGKCFKAHERHRLLFRRAGDGAVADVLVGITGYKPALPKPTTPVMIGAEDCSLTQRTIAVTLGQSIQLKNRGPSAVMPQLLGLPTPAVIAAVPGGDPVTLTPHATGRFELIDRSHPYANAEVFVVNYPTITVTDERGHFEIPGVPAEQVKVSVLLPATGLSAEKIVDVQQGKAVDVTFDLEFDLAKYHAALELGKRQEEAEKGPATSPSTSPVAP